MDCKIIQDLLPLYHDGVCSQESRREVETHLGGCETCRKLLADLDAPLPEAARAQAGGEASALWRLAREWKRAIWRARLKGAAAALAVCALLALGWVVATDWTVFPIPMERIQVSDVRQFSDGRILYHFSIDNRTGRMTIRWKFGEDGDLWLVPKRPLISVGMSPGDFQQVLTFPILDSYAQEAGVDTEIVRVWYGQGEDRILLWEEGMELPAASPQDEAAYGFDTQSAEYWEARRTDE